MKQLDPRAVWLFFFNYLIGILFLMIPFIFLFGFVFRKAIRTLLEKPELQQALGFTPLTLFLVEFWWLIFVLLIILAFIWSYLSYHFYRYALAEDGFRKELGVIWKKYVTIPYERIQNVDIYRGPLARILGLSNLQIQTAGLSATVGRYGVSGAGAEGRLPGISREEAERIRDELIKRARGLKNQGL